MIELRQLPPDDAPEWRVRAIRHLTEVRADAEAQQQPAVPTTPLADPGGEIWSINSDEGWLWCVPTEDGVALGDLMLPDTARPTDVWPSILDLLNEHGWRRLDFSVFRDDPVTTALAGVVESTLIATKMQLAITDTPAPTPATITLRPMTDDRYEAFHQRSTELYASELLASGSVTDPDAAERASIEEMAKLLPDGIATSDQLLFNAVDEDGDAAGELWIALQHQRAFLYDIMVAPDRRGQGLGSQMLRAAADITRDHGRSVLGLNVFGNNEGARRLYERSGFVTTESIHSVELLASTTMPHGTGSSSGSAT